MPNETTEAVHRTIEELPRFIVRGDDSYCQLILELT